MARRIVAEFDAVTGPFLQKLNRIDSSINRFERGTLTSFNRVERGVNTLVGAASRLRTFTGLFATGFGVNLGAQFLDQAKLIRNALREAGDTSEETFNKVFQSSVRALAGFRDTAAGVQRFQKALGDTQTIDQSIRQLETLNKLLALSGKTQQERSSTFIQFSQALQAGYLGGEELRAVRENAPIELTREIARVAGGTIEDLKDLSKEGLLTTEVLVEALRNLEEEADKRFSAIEVTIQDASKIFTSGAIIAAEAFDEGLGASDATVAGLKNLGEILGENSDAFETFGEAVKVAGALLITSFSGRRISRVIGYFRDLKSARIEASTAAAQEFGAAQRAQQAAKASLATRSTTLATLTAQGAATKKVEAAQKSQTKAVRRLQAANRRLATAYSAVTIAQNRLLFSQRALAASTAVLRGAFNFLGGVPGLILAAGTAFFVIRDRIEQAADAQKELLNVSRDYVDQLETLADRRKQLSDLLSDLGEDNLDGARGLIAELRGEIQSLKTSLEELRTAERQSQQERLALLDAQKQKLDELLTAQKFYQEQLKKPLSEFQQFAPSGQPGVQGDPLFTQEELQQRRDRAFAEIRSVLLTFEKAIEKATGDVENTEAAIAAARVKLQEFFKAAQDGGEAAAPSVKKFEEALETAREVIAENRTEAEKLEAEIARLEEVYNTLQQTTGSTSSVSERLQAVIDSLREKLAAAKAEARGLTGEMERLTDVLRKANNSQLDNAQQLALVERQLAAARAGASRAQIAALAEVAALDANRDALLAAGLPLDEFEIMRATAIATAAELSVAREELNDFLNPKTGGSGGGVTALAQAASIIESMMTDQERMKRDIAEAEKLRKRLAAGTELEQKAAILLADAIARMKDELALADNKMDVFFDSMAQNLANAITDWTNFGDVVRGILADLVREYGPDFFRAVFTPGQQANPTDSLGTGLGNILTGLFHDGGRSGRRRNVPASAFIGAPRFHKGFMPDEFPAILQKGEAVIPKGLVGGMGGGATFVFHNDFSNADPTMKPWIEAQLAEQRAQFESRWIQTARKVNMSRIKV